MQKKLYIYIITNNYNKVLYIGVTNNLLRRLAEHQSHLNKGSFSDTYNVYKLVHFEVFDSPMKAIVREKRLKKWKRSWKIELINKNNPEWKDLASGLSD